MATLFAHPLTELAGLEIRAEKAEVVTWQGREALRLEDGLALVPGLPAVDASIEVLIGTEGPAYPGIAFRVAAQAGYEDPNTVPDSLWDRAVETFDWEAGGMAEAGHGDAVTGDEKRL